MNFLSNILNGINKKKTLTLEQAIKVFKTDEKSFKEFENFYNKNILSEIPENYFEINS